MLILKRRREQSVQIGADVTVTILAISDGWVKLGISAPPAWDIDRSAQAGREQHIIARPVEGDILL